MECHIDKECTNPRKEDGDRPQGRPGQGAEGDAISEERKQVFEGTGRDKNYQAIPHSITGDNKVPSVENFEQLGLGPLILENIKKCGYDTPTPIQCHGSPQLMADRHVMCCAQTGSGKTAAFLLPIINRLLQHQDTLRCAGSTPIKPEALILAPTRELVIQIGKEATRYAAGSIIKTQVIYGETATPALKNELLRGCDILVATCGRLKQFIKEGIVDLSSVQYFILDEADRMMDGCLVESVEEIATYLRPKEERVSGMFSATFSPAVQNVAAKFLHQHVYIVIGIVGGACTDVRQKIIKVDRSGRRQKILDVLNEEGKDSKILVFCNCNQGADFLATHLATNKVSCTSFHGDRHQSQREQAMCEFTNGKRQVLVATSILARGIELPNVGLVINYDLPSKIEDYVNRIGRTGRGGHAGRAVSFYDENFDSGLLQDLTKVLKEAEQEVPAFLECDGGDFPSTDARNVAGNAAAASDDDDEW